MFGKEVGVGPVPNLETTRGLRRVRLQTTRRAVLRLHTSSPSKPSRFKRQVRDIIRFTLLSINRTDSQMASK